MEKNKKTLIGLLGFVALMVFLDKGQKQASFDPTTLINLVQNNIMIFAVILGLILLVAMWPKS